jgi:hypothetical protein
MPGIELFVVERVKGIKPTPVNPVSGRGEKAAFSYHE